MYSLRPRRLGGIGDLAPVIIYGVLLVSKIKFDMHSNMLCKAIGKMWNRSASCADSANRSAF